MESHGRRTPLHRALLIAAALSLALVGGAPPIPSTPARAQAPATEAVQPPKTVSEALPMLGSSRWLQRDAAQTFLMRQSATIRSQVEQALARSTDSEATARLRHIAVHLFLKGQTSFEGEASLLGIALSIETVHTGARNQDLRTAVAVVDLQPGFPAAEVLVPGDRIIALDGEAFATDMTIETFRSAVNASKPGTELTLTVLRAGRELKIPVRLAGIPERGAGAISSYVSQRNAKAAAYLRQLDAQSESPSALVIQDGEPPIPVRIPSNTEW